MRLAVAMACAGSVAAGAQAQVLEEITVTAQKREQNLQDVPSAVSALGADALVDAGVTDLSQISGVAPTLQVSQTLGVPNVFMRGIGTALLGSGNDSSVAFHADGIYIGSPRAQIGAFFDIDHIEVLRGPQGDLYGRNSSGGAINVISKAPSEKTDGYLRAGFGNYNSIDVEGAIGGAISGDRVLGRVAFVSLNHDGYGKNEANGRDINDRQDIGVRGQLQFRGGDSFDLKLIGEYYRADDHAQGWMTLGQGRPDVPLTGSLFGGQQAQGFRNIRSDLHPDHKLDSWGGTAVASWKLNDAFTLQSLTGYRHSKSYLDTEIDNTDFHVSELIQTERYKSFSEELQLQYESERVNAILGAFYFHSSVDGATDVPLPILELLGSTGLGILPVPFPPGTRFKNDGSVGTDAYAGFLHVDLKVTDRLNLGLGARYSYEKRDAHGAQTFPTPFAPTVVPIDDGKHWDSFTPKVSLDFAMTDDVRAYASFGKGFKSGIFLTGNLNPVVGPEKVDAWEIGLKTRLLDNRLQANFAAFYNKFKDLQVNRIVGATVVVENAASAKIKGIEAEFTAELGAGFDAVLTGAWLQAEFDDYVTTDPVRPELGELDLHGNKLPQAPKLTAYFNLRKRFALPDGGQIVASGSVNWRDDQYFDPFNQPNAFQKAYAELGARIGWESADGRWGASVWGRNLTNKKAITAKVITLGDIGYPALGSVNDPRTYGVEVSYNFGDK